ncbi:MAG: hypothetical protein JWO47_331 [Candidatus Saccharibacteria bacterium]|nr:hypothetical protein [Candidatus Saccharibacteria bacterium]
MTGTNHGMTGAVIALLVKEPALAVPLSFLSHFACDAVPHWGWSLKPGEKLFGKRFTTMLICDFIFAVVIMIVLGILFPSHRWLIWGCMIAAAIPDLMWAYYHLYLEKIKAQKPVYGTFGRFHKWIQWSETPKGLFVEGAWFVAMGAIILAQR